jgi:hypothetical protein
MRNDFPLKFLVDPSTNELMDLNLFIAVRAPGFNVEPPFRKIFIPPNMDSGVFSFFLKPSHVSERAYAILELFRDEERATLIGSLTITTEVKSLQREVVKVVWNLATLPLNIAIALSKHNSADYQLLSKAEDVSMRFAREFHFLRKEMEMVDVRLDKMRSVLYKHNDREIDDLNSLYNLTSTISQQLRIVSQRLMQILELDIEFNKNLDAIKVNRNLAAIKFAPNIEAGEIKTTIEIQSDTMEYLNEVRLVQEQIEEYEHEGYFFLQDTWKRVSAIDRFQEATNHFKSILFPASNLIWSFQKQIQLARENGLPNGSKTERELSTLTPSVLDRAFKGEFGPLSPPSPKSKSRI